MKIQSLHHMATKIILVTISVVTIALGSRPRKRVARLQAKKEAQESCCMFLRV